MLQEDPNLAKIMTAITRDGGIYHKTQQHKVDVCYEFDLDDFGPRQPRVVEKRLGKMSKKPVYLHFDDNFFEGFKRALTKRHDED